MKYSLDQTVFYMNNTAIVHSAPVLARSIVENLHDNWDSTFEQRSVFTPFGSSAVYYSTCHGVFLESEVFATREELMGSI